MEIYSLHCTVFKILNIYITTVLEIKQITSCQIFHSKPLILEYSTFQEVVVEASNNQLFFQVRSNLL
jgi:hypothetical protein